MNIKIKDYEVSVRIVNKNNKNIYFRFDDEQNLVITCSKQVGNDEILKLISENEDGLVKLYEKSLSKRKFDEVFHYLGKEYLISYSEEVEDVTINGEYIYAKDDEALNEFLLSEAKRIFNEEADICKRCFLNLPEYTIRLRKMRTRWGVCNTRNNVITLNTELIKRDINQIDYVIIHEMAHFYEGNHSRNFWDIVSKACPNYKTLRKDLKK